MWWIIAEKPNQIMRLDERFYKVASQSGNGMYDVTKKKKHWMAMHLPRLSAPKRGLQVHLGSSNQPSSKEASRS
jgi:hypothetical protein